MQQSCKQGSVHPLSREGKQNPAWAPSHTPRREWGRMESRLASISPTSLGERERSPRRTPLNSQGMGGKRSLACRIMVLASHACIADDMCGRDRENSPRRQEGNRCWQKDYSKLPARLALTKPREGQVIRIAGRAERNEAGGKRRQS